MLRFFFYLNIILFCSCVTRHLGVGDNHTKNKNIAQSHTDAFLKHFKGPKIFCDTNRTYGLTATDEKETIERVKTYFATNQNGIGSIMEPFFGKEGTSDSITPLTRLTDYPKDKRETVLALVNRIVILNSHLYVGMESVSTFVNNQESVHHNEAIRKTFIKVEEIALKAQMRFEAGKMFGDVMYEALKDITEYVEYLSRRASYNGCKRNDDFHANLKDIHCTLLNGRKHYVDMMKIVFDQYEEAKLAVTYAQYIHKEKFQKLGITPKVLELCDEIGNSHGARFYVEAITILEETKTEDDARKKINVAFQKAKEASPSTIDELVERIEGPKSKKRTTPRTNTKKTNINAPKQTKSKQKTQNLPPKNKDTSKVDPIQNTSPSTPDENEEEPQEAKTLLQSVEALQERFDKCRYKLHGRILRWSGASIHQIKNFHGYADFSEKDIMLQKAYHDLQGVELLLLVDDHANYFFKTSTGKSAFATIDIEGVTYEGMLEIGISDEGDIYHMIFNDKVKHKPEQLFQITDPILEDVLDDALENNNEFIQWCNKDGFEIDKKDGNYVITLDMPTSTTRSMHRSCRKLIIYPNKLSTKFIKKH